MAYPTLTYPTTGRMIKLVWCGVRFVFHGLVMPLTLTENGSGRATKEMRK